MGFAARALGGLNIRIGDVRAQVARIIGQGDEVTPGQIPFTPRAKRVLELSLREAMDLNHNHIGTEHVLLGLVRENEGVASRILLDFDVDAEKIRNEIIRLLPSGRRGEPAPEAFVPEAEASLSPTREPWPQLDSQLLTIMLASQRRLSLVILLALAAFPAGLMVGWLIWH
jgi:ATP-dependent Clp protease ATP-binding subunit ClpC